MFVNRNTALLHRATESGDITGVIDQLLALHRAVFGAARMDGDTPPPGDGPPADPPAEGDSGAADSDQPLGPAGTKALEAEKAKRRDEAARRRSAEQERDQLRAQLEAKDKPAEEQALDAARREARAEALAAANARIVAAEVRAAAAGKLADPSDALRLLDLSSIEVTEDGAVDAAALADAISDLIKTKPYLAAQGGKRFEGSADGGARNEPPEKSRVQQIAEAEKAGDWATAAALKAAALAEQLSA